MISSSFLFLVSFPNPANFEILAKVLKLFKEFVSQFEDWFVIGLNFSISISLDFGSGFPILDLVYEYSLQTLKMDQN